MSEWWAVNREAYGSQAWQGREEWELVGEDRRGGLQAEL